MMAATAQSAANRTLTVMPTYTPFMVCPVLITVPLATHSFLKTAAGGKGCFNLDPKKNTGGNPRLNCFQYLFLIPFAATTTRATIPRMDTTPNMAICVASRCWDFSAVTS